MTFRLTVLHCIVFLGGGISLHSYNYNKSVTENVQYKS